jgi:signal transduction histidine kinase
MGEMIGNIAHQWRQPLSSISAIASGAKLRYKNNMISDEELGETFDKIKLHTQHLSNTIDDFKNFLTDTREKEFFNIDEVVEKSISLVEAMCIDNKIKLNVEIIDKELRLNGNSSELSQVFLNILNNAKDVFVEKKVTNRVILIRVVKDENNVLVSIKDNAGGISKDIELKIFEPYFTTKHKSQGTGIGLFMSKKIVEQHYNGTLRSTNDEFEIDGVKYYGASFNIKIPLV